MWTRFRAIGASILVTLILVSCSDNSVEPVPGTGPTAFLGTGEYLGDYWPTDGWRSCRPEEVGINSLRLLQAYWIAANPEFNTQGLVIIKDGYIVGETYFRGFEPTDRHTSYSVAKSFSSAVIGIAIDKGYIADVNEKVYEYYPQWQQPETDPRKQQITIRHLLTMTSGIEWNEDDYYEDPSENDAFIMYSRPCLYEYVLDKPMENNPGETWYYSTGNSELLTGIIEEATDSTLYQFALVNLLTPIGLTDIGWHHDDAGHSCAGSGVVATVREFAKLGFLYLHNGEWDGRRIVPEAWIEESLQPVSSDVTWYGYHWWLRRALTADPNTSIPPSTFIAWGIYTQQIFVIPEKQLVIARVGSDGDPTHMGWNEVAFLTAVLESIND